MFDMEFVNPASAGSEYMRDTHFVIAAPADVLAP